jgi:hypothetical protein
MPCTPKPLSLKGSRLHLSLNNIKRILMLLRSEQIDAENFVAQCDLMLLIGYKATERRGQGRLSRAGLVPAYEPQLTLTAANLGLDE